MLAPAALGTASRPDQGSEVAFGLERSDGRQRKTGTDGSSWWVAARRDATQLGSGQRVGSCCLIERLGRPVELVLRPVQGSV